MRRESLKGLLLDMPNLVDVSASDVNVVEPAAGTGIVNALTGEKHELPLALLDMASRSRTSPEDRIAHCLQCGQPTRHYCDRCREPHCHACMEVCHVCYKDLCGPCAEVHGHTRGDWLCQKSEGLKRPAEWFRIPQDGAHNFCKLNVSKAPFAETCSPFRSRLFPKVVLFMTSLKQFRTLVTLLATQSCLDLQCKQGVWSNSVRRKLRKWKAPGVNDDRLPTEHFNPVPKSSTSNARSLRLDDEPYVFTIVLLCSFFRWAILMKHAVEKQAGRNMLTSLLDNFLSKDDAVVRLLGRREARLAHPREPLLRPRHLATLSTRMDNAVARLLGRREARLAHPREPQLRPRHVATLSTRMHDHEGRHHKNQLHCWRDGNEVRRARWWKWSVANGAAEVAALAPSAVAPQHAPTAVPPPLQSRGSSACFTKCCGGWRPWCQFQFMGGAGISVSVSSQKFQEFGTGGGGTAPSVGGDQGTSSAALTAGGMWDRVVLPGVILICVCSASGRAWQGIPVHNMEEVLANLFLGLANAARKLNYRLLHLSRDTTRFGGVDTLWTLFTVPLGGRAFFAVPPVSFHKSMHCLPCFLVAVFWHFCRLGFER